MLAAATRVGAGGGCLVKIIKPLPTRDTHTRESMHTREQFETLTAHPAKNRCL